MKYSMDTKFRLDLSKLSYNVNEEASVYHEEFI